MNRLDLSPVTQTFRMKWEKYPSRCVAYDNAGKLIASASTVFRCLDGVKSHLSALRAVGGPKTETTVVSPSGEKCLLKY